ncbi:hypothetical protein CRN84_25910 [Budvicia aquatica]|uniref:Uncharacterized protein n=1 Tax=Budvicia aquatica TaxID=82979 RepID=A0A2C6C840_9GAMM|nr:hypothetical protein CRN84_25910 [Budvicia aquatica]
MGIYLPYFKLHFCWLRSLGRITYLSKLIGAYSLAAAMQLELFWVYTCRTSSCFQVVHNSIKRPSEYKNRLKLAGDILPTF